MTDIHPSLENLRRFLSENYPGGVPRPKIDEATGKILCRGTCANADSAGNGIPGRFKIGRTVVYPVDGIIKYLSARLQ